ncbi:protein of unknown function [Arenibacter nanhaiticus]|uniref:DUF4834 domain-containing protein n=1 Tax=Arenibacter nanhaiticus TaxID=558155 RepID=A0A1M6DLD5_9FLAO|nr:DUF4834 family protein [Arenibacter nanhaiticus]SHI74005.1 protein of unknown function [Arenibacter nanhaiticus]
MGFLRTILIILLVYYLLKILAKWLGPILLRYAAKKTQDHFNKKFGGYAQQNNYTEEQNGEVIIEKKNSKKTKPSKKVGEYIDFEEIE